MTDTHRSHRSDSEKEKRSKLLRWDLREETDPYLFYQKCQDENTRKIAQSQDTYVWIGHPVCVAATVTISIAVFIWGIVAWRRYASGIVPHLAEIWWQTSVLMMLIVVLGLVLPPRIRFGYNWYGLISLLLITEYLALVAWYPLMLPSGEDLALFRQVVTEEKAKRSLAE